MLRKAGPLVLAAGLAFLAAAPVEWFEHGPTLCLFKRFLGIECLGCGMTRALSSLLHGDVVAALAHNRLVAVAFPLLVVFLVRALTARQAPRTRTRRASLTVVSVPPTPAEEI